MSINVRKSFPDSTIQKGKNSFSYSVQKLVDVESI